MRYVPRSVLELTFLGLTNSSTIRYCKQQNREQYLLTVYLSNLSTPH